MAHPQASSVGTWRNHSPARPGSSSPVYLELGLRCRKGKRFQVKRRREERRRVGLNLFLRDNEWTHL